MGRPINKKWFGTAIGAELKIIVQRAMLADGTTLTDAVIVKQTGTRTYVVQDQAKTRTPEAVTLVNGPAQLAPGKCYIKMVPFGGTVLNCEKIQQYRVKAYETDGSIKAYTWSKDPATQPGQADLFLIQLD